MFQFRRFPSYTYFIQYMIPCGGFPHSEISGSQLICSSPKLIAAYHVLHRLLMPRHSPCALISLTILSQPNQKSPIGSLISWIMQAHFRSFSLAKIVFITQLVNKKFPFMLPSHNCIIIDSMFSFQGTCVRVSPDLNLARDSMKHWLSFLTHCFSQSLLVGGEYRDRTGDLLLARQALSQLS